MAGDVDVRCYTTRYSSTVFACETSDDTKLVRCDLNICADHGQDGHLGCVWLNNRPNTVERLEAHVTEQIEQFLQHNAKDKVVGNPAVRESHQLPEVRWIRPPADKSTNILLVTVLELADRHAALASWLFRFLESALGDAKVLPDCSLAVGVVVLRFASRFQLLRSVASLQSLCGRNVQMLVYLSCHSSSQGQVFSCTPSDVTSQTGFEEFCSVHDFVRTCQDELGPSLSGVHLSTCFALRLDSSHKDWPVDVAWIRNHLKITLSGSSGEIFETGSQVVDLWLLLFFLERSARAVKMRANELFSLRGVLWEAVASAQRRLFPNLAQEMGLLTMDASLVKERMTVETEEEEAHPRPNLTSTVRLMLLVTDLPSSEEHCSRLLAQAVKTNVGMRTDMSTCSSVVTLPFSGIAFGGNGADDSTAIEDAVFQGLRKMELPRRGLEEEEESRCFFVILSPFLCNFAGLTLNAVERWKQLVLIEQRTSVRQCGNEAQSCQAVLSEEQCGGYTQMTFTSVERYSSEETVETVRAVKENSRNSLSGGVLAQPKSPVHTPEDRPHQSHGTPECVGLPWKAKRKDNDDLREGITNLNHGMNFQNEDNGGCHVTSGDDEASEILRTRVSHELVSAQCNIPVSADQPPAQESRDPPSSLQGKSEQLSKEELALRKQEQEQRELERFLQQLPRSHGPVFGVHFQSLTKAQLSDLRQTWQPTIDPPTGVSALRRQHHGGVSSAFSLLLYLVHLVVGENCLVHSLYGKSVLRRATHWTMERIYNEVCLMLTGMAVELNFTLLSAAPLSMVGHSRRFKLPAGVIESWQCGLYVGQWPWPKDNEDFVAVSELEASKEVVQSTENNITDSSDANFSPSRVGSGKRRKSSESLQDGCRPLAKKRQKMRSAARKKETPRKETEMTVLLPADATVEEVKGETDVHKEALTDSDLPMVSNWKEVLVSHYFLDWMVDFEQRVICGEIRFQLEPPEQSDVEELASPMVEVCSCPSKGLCGLQHVVLDCCKLDVKAVNGLYSSVIEDYDNAVRAETAKWKNPSKLSEMLSVEDTDRMLCASLSRETATSFSPREWCNLKYCVDKWSLSVERLPDRCCFPRVFSVSYSTKPDGDSLTWTADADGRLCVFTRGAAINNRSLYPGQDVPDSKSTWQARVCVPQGCVPLMSGDAVCIDRCEEGTIFFWSMSVPLWCCTLAFAAGWHSSALLTANQVVQQGGICQTSTQSLAGEHGAVENSSIGSYHGGDDPDEQPSLSVWCCPSRLNSARRELSELAYSVFRSACVLLGDYPFQRVDLLVLPRSFGCLGLANPNLIFLSPSVLPGDGSMVYRLAHEIAHAWFGLHIGAKDWTEEWLSEGFCTFCEERIVALAMKWDEHEQLNRSGLRMLLKRRALASELLHTSESLQVMKPTLSSDGAGNRGDSVTCVKDALDGSKCFMQVHYVKGYLLLHHLASRCSYAQFDQFLKQFTTKVGGTNITSREFFEQYFSVFSHLENEEFNPKSVERDWLCQAGMPPVVDGQTSDENPLIAQVYTEFGVWRKRLSRHSKTTHPRPSSISAKQDICWIPEQIVLLLELLLEVKSSIKPCCLRQLQAQFELDAQNAEVRHRWCELVVAQKYKAGHSAVTRLLTEDQGMGVYLYGELILSRQPYAQQLALTLYKLLQQELDRDAACAILEMVLPLLPQQNLD